MSRNKRCMAFATILTLAALITGCSQDKDTVDIASITNMALNEQTNIQVEINVKENEEEINITYNKTVGIEKIKSDKKEIYIQTVDGEKIFYIKESESDEWLKTSSADITEYKLIQTVFAFEKDSFENWEIKTGDTAVHQYIGTYKNNGGTAKIEYDSEQATVKSIVIKTGKKEVTVIINKTSRVLALPAAAKNAMTDMEKKMAEFQISTEDKWTEFEILKYTEQKEISQTFEFEITDKITRLEIFYDKSVPSCTLLSPNGTEYKVVNKTYTDNTAIVTRTKTYSDLSISMQVIYLETLEPGTWKITVDAACENNALIIAKTKVAKNWLYTTQEVKTMPEDIITYYVSTTMDQTTLVKTFLTPDTEFTETEITTSDENNPIVVDKVDRPIINISSIELLLLIFLIVGAGGGMLYFKVFAKKNVDSIKEVKEKILSEEDIKKTEESLKATLAKYDNEYTDDIEINKTTMPILIEYEDEKQDLIKKNTLIEKPRVMVERKEGQSLNITNIPKPRINI